MSASGITHDLNGVLTIMLGWVELARRDEIDPQQRAAALEILERGARRALAIVRDRQDGGHPAGTGFSAVAVDAVIEELLDFHRLVFERKRIDVVVDLEPGLMWEGDAVGLFRVIENLLGNAAEAMNDGGHLRVESGFLANGRLGVVVEDDGPGVDPSIAGRLFDHGFTTKADGEGGRVSHPRDHTQLRGLSSRIS